MKFELKEYHRDLSDDALLYDIRRISEKHPEKYISRSLYEKEGVYSATPFLRRWGSWIGVLEAAGLRTERKPGDYKRIDNKELIDDVVRIAEMLSKNSVTTKEYSEYGKYKVQTLLSRFKSWNSVLDAASLAGTGYKVIKDTDLYEEIERLWIEKGSQPTTTDIKSGNSKYSLNTYSRRFGGWRGALQAFLQYINEENEENGKDITVENNLSEERAPETKKINRRKTPRDINLRLRFRVLQRDNFSCCACGASPAKDASVVLHVDHIDPWSKGGETVEKNLQTLCDKCNLGKSNVL